MHGLKSISLDQADSVKIEFYSICCTQGYKK